MEHRNGLPSFWFGSNVLNITAIVGKNGTGKTNLLDCIIKALCGQGGGLIIFRYKGKLYTNVPKIRKDITFTFEVEQFNRGAAHYALSLKNMLMIHLLHSIHRP